MPLPSEIEIVVVWWGGRPHCRLENVEVGGQLLALVEESSCEINQAGPTDSWELCPHIQIRDRVHMQALRTSLRNHECVTRGQ